MLELSVILEIIGYFQTFEITCVLVIEGEASGAVRSLGYILGTTDTRAYNCWFDREWRPAAAAMYPQTSENSSAATPPSFSQRIRTLFHTPFCEMPWFDEYPGHIHIDLLPAIQGGGWGRLLMEAYEERLKNLGCKGFHLGVGGRNGRAVDFYRRYGMIELHVANWGVVFGKRL